MPYTAKRRGDQTVSVLLVLLCAARATAEIPGIILEPAANDTVPRYFHAASRLDNGLIMVTGGLTVGFNPISLKAHDAVSFFDPATRTFSPQFQPTKGGEPTSPRLNTPRSGHTQTTLLDGRILITGGDINPSGTNPGKDFNGVELFHPDVGIIWTGPPMSANRSMHTATLLPDGRVCVAGDETWQVFYPETSTWSPNAPLARTRQAHAAALLANYQGNPGQHRVLLIGGYGSGPDTLEILDPDTGKTSLLPARLTIGVDDLAAVPLPDGRIFIAGGQNPTTGNTTSLTYLYDPKSDTLTAGPDIPDRIGGMADHHMIQLQDYLAVFGGEQQQSGTDTVLNYIALFNTLTGQWTETGTMLNLHDDFAAVPFGHCSILVIDGGQPFFGEEIPSNLCEIMHLDIPGQCIPGDCNHNGHANQADVPNIINCLESTDMQTTPTCACCDANADNRIDLQDFAAFQEAYSQTNS